MDILAHTLWTAAAAKTVNFRLQKKVNVRWSAFWGVFPDLFAFTLPFTWLIWQRLFGNPDLARFPRPEHTEPVIPTPPVFNLASTLYNYSHSLIIFAVVFAVIWGLRRRPVWELLGWLLHILIDIPSHTTAFYPTPLFWPISNFRTSGVSWADPKFMVINYSALIVTYLIFFLVKRRKKI